MRRQAGWLLGLASAMMVGCLSAPVLWSPDGRWLAYTVAVRADGPLLEPGWLFRTGSGGSDDLLGWGDPARRPAAAVHRIWATEAETGVSVLLEQSPGPLSSPAWSPDGKALAFIRLVPEANGRVRFQVVVQDAPDRKRVILSVPPADYHARVADLPALTLAWSPDGRYLAIPWYQQPGSLGLAIIRADNGRILKEVADAYLPSWAPDGTRLAFVRGGASQSLHVLDTTFGPSRQLADVGQVGQAPFWSRDKHWVMVVARRASRRPGVPSQRIPELVRVPVDGGQEVSVPLPADRSEPDRADLGLSFSFDPEGDHFFYTVDMNRRQSQVVLFIPRNKETRRVENPVDFTVRLSSLAVSPNGKTVAFRAGGPNFFATPGVWDLASNGFRPLVPDDAARAEWIGTLVAAAREVLRTFLPDATTEKGRTIERATFLPIPGELPENHESIYRLRRLGRTGRALCDRPPSAPPADPALLELIDEARLFFCYLCADHDAALAALETLEERTTSADHRLRLLSVRAQLYLAKGENEQAERTIEFLQSLERRAPRRIETTPAGTSLTEDGAPGQGWSTYLAAQAKKAGSDSRKTGPGDRLGPPNPDAPNPLGNGAFPFAPGNRMDLRRDDIPFQVGPGDLPPPGFRQMPRRVDPLPPEFRRPGPQGRRGFRPRPPFE